MCISSHLKVDDVFSEDKKKTKKAKGKAKVRPDEDLFGDTDDIFGGIETKPKSPKTVKKKKKTTAAAKGSEEKEGGATNEAPPTEGM